MNENLNDEMKELADALAPYLWEKHFAPKLDKILTFYRATVTRRAASGTIQITRPFDDTVQSLPYVGSAANLAVGTEVVVVCFGGENNARILGPVTLTNL